MEILCKTLEELELAAQNTDPELIITLDFPRENIIPELPHIHGSYQLIGSTIVAKVTGTTVIKEMTNNSIVQSMWTHSIVQSMSHHSIVQKMWDNSTVQRMGESSTVHTMLNNSTVHGIYHNSTVHIMHGNSTVQNMYNKSTVRSMWENSHVHINSPDVIINAYHQALVTSAIPIEQLQNVSKHDEATVVYRPLFKHNQTTFSQVYQANLVDKETIRLYKSVKEDHTDFWTGRIKYEGTVECPDWDPDPERQCGGGLHLSPTPELALEYNQGKVLECHVKLEDMVVYPYDVTKVRCRTVEVVGEAGSPTCS